MRLAQQRGQAVIESALALPVAILAVSGFLVLIWGLATSLLGHHVIYEMLICRQIQPVSQNCEVDAKNHLQQILFFGSAPRFDYQESRWQSSVQVQVDLPLHLSLHLQENVSLPLESP